MELTLTATTGRELGSRTSGRLRNEGKVPGVVYGLGRDAVAVAVEWTELRRVLTTDAGLNALIDLEIDGETELTLVKDMQRDPVRRDVLHVDFLRLDRDAETSVDVPILLTGFAKDVEDRRGIVDQTLKTFTVNAKPADIPTQFEIDVTDLTIGGVITVADVELPRGVSTDLDPEAPVVVGVGTRFTTLIDAGVDPSDAAFDEEGTGYEAEGAEGAEASDESESEGDSE
ncbi:50S ribosomal protein L25 [Rhabdothermincola salaria]|uniref:50S ribosomal protein L25 n=1 Tax=Rhabdothermincola salaria TaxID=2903142 RepID=UPI001E2BC01D|nr:50S ribosomal protein L25 [Rhabdothermincola salaria]MCD9623490.1 50S ribosomal protein L25 [Rhabdothermincola salaria]